MTSIFFFQFLTVLIVFVSFKILTCNDISKLNQNRMLEKVSRKPSNLATCLFLEMDQIQLFLTFFICHLHKYIIKCIGDVMHE